MPRVSVRVSVRVCVRISARICAMFRHCRDARQRREAETRSIASLHTIIEAPLKIVALAGYLDGPIR